MIVGKKLTARVDEWKRRRNIRARERRDAKRKWHPHFLKFPAFIDGFTLVWLETVERRWVASKWPGEGYFEYREIAKP